MVNIGKQLFAGMIMKVDMIRCWWFPMEKLSFTRICGEEKGIKDELSSTKRNKRRSVVPKR